MNELELKEPDKVLGNVEEFDREVELRQILNVMELRVSAGVDTKTACKELGYDYRRMLRLINNGVLQDYLTGSAKAEKGMIQLQVLSRMGNVVRNMLDIAEGKKQIKGVNPVAAANFVKQYLDDLEEISRDEEREEPNLTVNVFPVEQIPIQYNGASPVIEGTVRELPSGDESPEG